MDVQGLEHLRQVVAQLDEAVSALKLSLGEVAGLADPATVADCGRAVEDAMEYFWAPVVWDQFHHASGMR